MAERLQPRRPGAAVLPALVLCLAVVGIGACSSSVDVPAVAPGEVVVLDSAEAAALMRNGDILTIDARPREQYLGPRPVGMQNISFDDQELWSTRIATLDTDEPVAVYCDTDDCSAKAAAALDEAGFAGVYDLGGVESWDPDFLTVTGPV